MGRKENPTLGNRVLGVYPHASNKNYEVRYMEDGEKKITIRKTRGGAASYANYLKRRFEKEANGEMCEESPPTELEFPTDKREWLALFWHQFKDLREITSEKIKPHAVQAMAQAWRVIREDLDMIHTGLTDNDDDPSTWSDERLAQMAMRNKKVTDKDAAQVDPN